MELPEDLKAKIVNRMREMDFLLPPESFEAYQLGFADAIEFIVLVGNRIKNQEKESLNDQLSWVGDISNLKRQIN